MSSAVLAAANPASEVGFVDYFPDLNDLFEMPAFLFEGSAWFAFNRTALLYLLAAAITVALTMVAFGNAKVVPGKFQAGMEALVDFVRNDIARPIMGPQGLRYLPLLFSLFLFILINNIYEVIPGINFPPTSRMALPALLTLTVYFVFILAGIKAQGFKYFWNAVAPPGLHWLLYILVVPIEFVSTFLVRPLTLAVRLFANLMAGHILLSVVFLGVSYNLLDFSSLTSPDFFPQGAFPGVMGILMLAGGVGLVLFEVLVSALQAYIFTALTAVYIGGAIAPEH